MTPAAKAKQIIDRTAIPAEGYVDPEAGASWVAGDRDNIELAIIDAINEAVAEEREAIRKVAIERLDRMYKMMAEAKDPEHKQRIYHEINGLKGVVVHVIGARGKEPAPSSS